jgi:hypothetical protein
MAIWQFGNLAMSRSARPSLAETMKRAARPETAAPMPVPSEQTPATAPGREGRGFYAATRAGKKKLTAAVDPAAHLQFRQLALELGKGGEALQVEAINDLFRKYGKPPIA